MKREVRRILILGGTSDANLLAQFLMVQGYFVVISTLTEMGRERIPEGVESITGEFSAKILHPKAFDAVVDATHPFAIKIKQLAMQSCENEQIPYLRFERPSALSNENIAKQVVCVNDLAAAVEAACEFALGKSILLTIGIRNLAAFVEQGRERSLRVIARIFPEESSLAACRQLGIESKDIVAIQAPLSIALEIEMLRYFDAGVVVMKDSGQQGGTALKIEAARTFGATAVVIGRPPLSVSNVAYSFEEVRSQLQEALYFNV